MIHADDVDDSRRAETLVTELRNWVTGKSGVELIPGGTLVLVRVPRSLHLVTPYAS